MALVNLCAELYEGVVVLDLSEKKELMIRPLCEENFKPIGRSRIHFKKHSEFRTYKYDIENATILLSPYRVCAFLAGGPVRGAITNIAVRCTNKETNSYLERQDTSKIFATNLWFNVSNITSIEDTDIYNIKAKYKEVGLLTKRLEINAPVAKVGSRWGLEQRMEIYMPTIALQVKNAIDKAPPLNGDDLIKYFSATLSEGIRYL